MSIYIYRVQAENENFSPSTFLNGIDPKNNLAAIFLTSGTVFAYHQGPLACFAKNGTKQLLLGNNASDLNFETTFYSSTFNFTH